MQLSIKSRLAFLCVLLVLATAGALMWFAHKDTITALRSSERRTLNNVLFLLEEELAAAHGENLQNKREAVNTSKATLQSTAENVGQILHSGKFQTLDAMHAVLRTLDEFPSLHPVSIHVFPLNEVAFAHTGQHSSLPAQIVQRAPFIPDNSGEFFWDAAGDKTLWRIHRQGNLLITCSSPISLLEAASQDRLDTAGKRFMVLLRDVTIQKTGFAAVLDARGEKVAGPDNTKISSKLKALLADANYVGASRRVVILPEDDTPDSREVFYLIGYFPPLGWHIVLAAPIDELEAPAVTLVARQMGITLAVMAAALLLGFLLARRISGPLIRLTRTIKDFSKTDIVTLDITALSRELPSARKDEVGALARSFEYMATELKVNVSKLLQTTIERQRFENELKVARDIQYGILPAPIKGEKRFALHASLHTAKEVGGDLYDFFFLDDKHLCFVIGDVSDKGVPAALFMSMTVTLLRTVMQKHTPPHEALQRINDALSRDNPRSMFVTLLICVLDLETGVISYANAGHLLPVIINTAGAQTVPLQKGMVAGAFEGSPYSSGALLLRPGDILFLYTDGISEAMDASGHLLGEGAVLQTLSPLAGTSPEAVTEHIMRCVAAHANGAEQSDDIAILTLQYLG